MAAPANPVVYFGDRNACELLATPFVFLEVSGIDVTRNVGPAVHQAIDLSLHRSNCPLQIRSRTFFGLNGGVFPLEQLDQGFFGLGRPLQQFEPAVVERLASLSQCRNLVLESFGFSGSDDGLQLSFESLNLLIDSGRV